MQNTIVTACVLVIGNEILSGRTQDKNLAWLAVELNVIGVRLLEARVIPDIHETIVATLNECRARFDYVFTTGGIGPTHDDITTRAVAATFGKPVLRHPEAEATLLAHYGREQLNAARLKMAEVPEGSALIANPVSAAPGYRIGNVYVMAGVPVIMQAMFAAIKHELKGGAPVLSRTLTTRLTEGLMAEGLTQIQKEFPNVEIGSYPHFQKGNLGVSLVLRSTDASLLARAAGEVAALITGLGGEAKEG